MLQPCPFCGASHATQLRMVNNEAEGFKKFRIFCDVCHASGPTTSNLTQTDQEACDDAAAKWNRRVV